MKIFKFSYHIIIDISVYIERERETEVHFILFIYIYVLVMVIRSFHDQIILFLFRFAVHDFLSFVDDDFVETFHSL